MKKVSLILTTYNCRENLKRTLDSIEIQDYADIEVIIKDGGSTDGTLDSIKRYQADSRFDVRWLSEKDSGIYAAMNEGYRMSSGEIIVFFNDLFLSNTAVSCMVEAIEKGGDGCKGAHADLIYATDTRIIRYWKMGKGTIRQGWMPGHPTLYLKREVYEEYGLYNETYICSADYEFMVRILKDARIELAYVPQTLVRMYYGGTSTVNAAGYWVSIKEAHRALKENGVKFALVIDMIRTFRVVIQFIRAYKRQRDYGKYSN